jgi:hypothetical protein
LKGEEMEWLIQEKDTHVLRRVVKKNGSVD